LQDGKTENNFVLLLAKMFRGSLMCFALHQSCCEAVISRIIENFKNIEGSQYSNYEYASTKRDVEEQRTTKYLTTLVFAFVFSGVELLD
jgi:hypothetical protein